MAGMFVRILSVLSRNTELGGSGKTDLGVVGIAFNFLLRTSFAHLLHRIIFKSLLKLFRLVTLTKKISFRSLIIFLTRVICLLAIIFKLKEKTIDRDGIPFLKRKSFLKPQKVKQKCLNLNK